MTTTRAPTKEAGTQTQQVSFFSDNAFIDLDEYAADLTWPNSTKVYDRMLTDAQIQGLLRGVLIPIRKYRWYIDPNGSRPEVHNALASDLGLPLKDDRPDTTPQHRRKRRFIHDHHLNTALKALTYGHYYFEQVGEIRDGMWHLRKLAPRPPKTISQILLAQDGNLAGIKQFFTNPQGIHPGQVPDIPVENLAAYIWDQDPGNWVGRSMLRACYRDWVVKDSLIRVDAVKHQRTGMGVPLAEAPEGASPEQIKELDALARSMRVYEAGGGAVPYGTKLSLLGTTGSVPDTLASIKFHNEEMARAFLMMFMQLGQTESGSRALGREFIDFFGPIQLFVADWYCDVTNEHVIEDWVDWNFGEDEQPPIIGYHKVNDENLEVADLVKLVESGAVVMDKDLYEAIRERYKLPEPDAATAVPFQKPSAQPVGVNASENGHGERSISGAEAKPTPSLSLPARPLRRDPYAHEITASIDFASIDVNLTGAVDQLVSEITVLQRAEIQELHDQIVAAGGSLKKLANLAATPVASDAILSAMTRTASMGATDAVSEGVRQGNSSSMPDLSKLDGTLRSRAEAVDKLLASSLSQSASREAIRRTGPGVDASAVADQVQAFLTSLSNTYLNNQANGALTQAMNSGRKATFTLNPPERLYSSELLDESTCEECAGVDGTEYPDVSAAEADYPTGGYVECAGLDRCRGTLVGVYGETPASV